MTLAPAPPTLTGPMGGPARAVALLLIFALFAIAPAASRGAGEKPPAAAPEEPATAIRVFREAPALASLVAEGNLPAVEKRLPMEPQVLEPLNGTGSYGGSWRLAVPRNDLWSLWTLGLASADVRLSADLTSVKPEVLQSVETSPDHRVFTLHLRKGLRWSDGDVCDADDYLFAWQATILDPDLMPAKPAELVVDGKLPRFDKIDQNTIRLTFASPSSMFLRRLAQPRSGLLLVQPQHYLRQFHARYAPKERLDALLGESGFADWKELFSAMSAPWRNPKLPVLNPWVLAELSGEGATEDTVVLERNPYFFQVDVEGSQLPYLDRVEVSLVDDEAAKIDRAAAGEIELGIVAPWNAESREALERGAGAGGFRLAAVEPMHANIHTIFLNRTTADSAKAKLFGDPRFREALSVSIDREAINAAIHRGQASPSQVSPAAGSPAYEEETALFATAHDLERADTLLDDIGLAWDAKRERRLGADGKPLELAVIFPSAWPSGEEQAVAMIGEDWKKIGIALTSTSMTRAEWLAAMQEGEWELASYAVNVGGGAYLHLSSDGVFPLDGYWFPSPQWGLWISTEGSSGMQPPPEVAKLAELAEEYMGSATGTRARDIEREAFGLYARELMAIGILSRPRDELRAVVSERLRNLPEGPLLDDVGVYHPATFWLAQP